MEDKEKSKLVKLKEAYAPICQKYDLPSFLELNEDFAIEKISDLETDFLIREVRKFVGDKLVNYLRFIESLINPVNAPMFTLTIVKLISLGDRNKLGEIYKELIKKEIEFIELDIKFDEVKEAIFIKESYSSWQKIKLELLDIISRVNNRSDEKSESESKGYFG